MTTTPNYCRRLSRQFPLHTRARRRIYTLTHTHPHMYAHTHVHACRTQCRLSRQCAAVTTFPTTHPNPNSHAPEIA